MIESQVAGFVEAGFEPVRDVFAANFERFGEVGAAFCVHHQGRRIVDLATRKRHSNDPFVIRRGVRYELLEAMHGTRASPDAL